MNETLGFREETVEPYEGDKGAEARPKYLCWREWRSPYQGSKGSLHST